MVSDLKPLSSLGLTPRRGGDSLVGGLAMDSRAVQPGDLFAALPGSRVHGATFVDVALRRQAAAILTDLEGVQIASAALNSGGGAALVVVEDARAAFANAAALWFGPQPETVVAVTGTNGKTSVASFTRQIWNRLGHRAANVGTTGVEGDFAAPGIHTTPDPLTLHRLMAEMAASGIGHVAMEASSHGLDQRRMDGVGLAAAAFTNFSQDHLDYHTTMAAYFDAKARLFRELLPEGAVAVLNLDDPKGAELAQICAGREIEVIGVAHYADARLKLSARRMDETGQDVLITWQDMRAQARLDLIGSFQAMNVLTAAGLAIAAGAAAEEVFTTLPRLTGVRGRMQRAAVRANGAPVFVDYAHTPDALEVALKALRPHVLGRIVLVFGAGGDRDRSKRPLMGQAAARHADLVIVTDDNPRTEAPDGIRREILAAVPDAAEIGDRAEAILRGVAALGPGDALLIAGKGHETGQTVGTTVYPFDDVEQASLAVAVLEGRE